MSRIHDALRRAEQEKGIITPPVMPPGPPSGPPDVASPYASSAFLAVEGSTSAASAPQAPSETLTLEAIEAGCAKSAWKPDPKTVLFIDSGDRSIGTEEFRALRSRLDQIRDKQPLRTLLITSAIPGEGKSFVAANLAQAIMQQPGSRVLLIDADLRKSQLHVLLGASPGPGLSDYLAGEAEVLWVLQRGQQEGLFLISGGKPATNPLELIENGRLKSLLHRLVPVFNWVILDSPPSVPLTDASLLARECDGVLAVVKAGSTPYDIAQKGCQQFQSGRLVGVVLNRAVTKPAYSAYYYYSEAEAKNGRK